MLRTLTLCACALLVVGALQGCYRCPERRPCTCDEALRACSRKLLPAALVKKPRSKGPADYSGLLLPDKLGPSTREAPASLEALLELQQLVRAPLSRFEEALAPHVGARVRWDLRSWGGETTTGEGFSTPSGRQPPKLGAVSVGRIRMISRTLGPKAGLGTVMDAGHPVVVCLALFPPDDDDRFVNTEDNAAFTPKRGPAAVEGTVWGVTKGPHLWLHNCRKIK